MIHTLFDSLIRQDKEVLRKSIYLNTKLSEAALNVCVNLIFLHFSGSNKGKKIVEMERWESDNFFLSHLSVENHKDIVPLIWTIENDSPKVAGIVMPFDDLSNMLINRDSNAIGKLSAKWITLQVISKRKGGS